MTTDLPLITVDNLTMQYGDRVIQRDLSFTVQRGEIFIVMGVSGCGKTTLLRHLVGLYAPHAGRILYEGESFWDAPAHERSERLQGIGILYQNGALWTSMTLAENVALPLKQYTHYTQRTIQEIVSYKLALVGLAGFEEFYPAELSGGMQKRAGLARAMALDPEVLYFDEPSSGLDPLNSKLLDDLILELNQGLGTTVVVVTHELPSIFAIGTDSIFLDTEARTIIARGAPRTLLESSHDPRVIRFLTRGARER